MSQLIANYTITHSIGSGRFQFENKVTTLSIACNSDSDDETHKEAITAICSMEKVNPEQIKIIGLLTLN